jgi:hypothetical protein
MIYAGTFHRCFDVIFEFCFLFCDCCFLAKVHHAVILDDGMQPGLKCFNMVLLEFLDELFEYLHDSILGIGVIMEVLQAYPIYEMRIAHIEFTYICSVVGVSVAVYELLITQKRADVAFGQAGLFLTI